MANKIPWYPWLNDAYKNIINQHQKQQGHHALLLNSHSGIGSSVLIYAISRWLICQQPEGIKSCGKCYSCRLMLAETHPDWYKISSDRNNLIGIEIIRYLIEELFNCSQHGGAKVVWFQNIEKLTEEATNALLKILEEPTNQTYFLLECPDPKRLLSTVRSRCFYYYLHMPSYDIVINWLQQQQIMQSIVNIETAIKISMGAPLTALTLLKSENWLKRKQFFKLLLQYLSNNTLLSLLNELNQPNVMDRIYWLISVLLDAVKYQQQANNYFINKDQLVLIAILAKSNSTTSLLKLANEWQTCRHQLKSIVGLNQQLCLISQLISWQDVIIRCHDT